MAPPVAEVVEELASERRLGSQVVETLYLPPAPARYGDLDPPLPAVLAAALAGAGVGRLWSHQAEGLAAVRRGEDVLITTPTASGKSLVFHLPVLEEAQRGGPGRALFLYPLKALGQDQKKKFDTLAARAGLAESAGCEIYDGDTPQNERRKIKRRLPRVLVSNPDMLHLGLLGYWQSWEPYLRDLRWIVLDELHTYRGIFGSHFHHVLQRLFRVCARLGARPVLVASSATAANADEFGRALAGRPFRWVAESGGPREGRHFLLVRPETSPYTAALQLMVALIESGLKTIVFTKARRITELLYSWLRQQSPGVARRVKSYRSGFLPEERRRIEAGLFEGRLDGVISTSALEMGIDVGGLDACVLVGYPGSVMATLQRSGRVGRGERESITALVALPDALDQYLLEHPGELVERPLERLIVDPANEPVGRAHLVCAAAELPLSKSADAAYLERHAATVGYLLRLHELAESADGRELYARRLRPQRAVSLRGAGESATILDATSGRVVGTVDGVRVMHECHPGAVYLHAGRQYLVRELDLEAGKAHAEPVRLDYFTTPLTEKETEILEILERREEGPLRSWLGRLLVTERVVGYERKRIRGRDVLDRHQLDLPPVRFETVGLWFAAPRPIEESIARRDEHFMGALHAAEHAAISLFPLLAICDRGDIGGISIPLHPQVRSGCVFIYDGHPGGVGIAARGFGELRALLARVRALLESCDCEEGCPSCVQSPKCGNGNRPLDKAGAARLLRLLLGEEEPLVPMEEAPPVEIEPVADPRALESEAAVWREPALPAAVGAPAPSAAPAGDREAARGSPPADEKRRPVEPGVRYAGGPPEPARTDEAVVSPEARVARRPADTPAAPPDDAPPGHRFDDPPAPPTESDTRPRRAPPGRFPEPAEQEPWDDVDDYGPEAARRARLRRGTRFDRRSSVDRAAPRPGAAGSPVVRPDDLPWSRRRRRPAHGLPAWPRRPRRPERTVLFDLETQRSAAEVGGWFNAHRMLVAVGVVCHLEEGRLEAFDESGVRRLVECLEAADLVVGFNVRRFDYRVLSGYTGVDYSRRLPTLDLLEEIYLTSGFRLGLNHLAAQTLGTEKTADGLQSLEWVRQGRLDLVEDYCRKDVEILRDLYLFGRRVGHVLYRDKRDRKIRLPVDW